MSGEVFEEFQRTGFMSQMASVYTCLPCVVIGNADIASQRIDVQPVVNKRYKNDKVEQHPPILAVPLIFPSSSTSALTFPVNIGDTVLCVFSQRGLDTFKNSNPDSRFVTPVDFRKFDKRDAIAIPGLFPFSESVNSSAQRSLPHSTSDMVLAHNLGGAEVEIRLKADGSLNIKSPTSVNVECPVANISANTTTWTGNMTYNGNITLNGNLVQSGIYDLDGVNMNMHVHGGVSTGPSKTSVPE
jgi:hypothetical protein